MTSSSDHQTHLPIGSAPPVRLPLVRTPLQGPYTAMYGSDVVAARYCGFRRPPTPPVGLWMHGWYPERRRLIRPERLFDVTMGHLEELRYWVTTERQADFLRRLGFSHARAIGLPLAYVPEPRVDRDKNSLLVMPAHSLPANDRAWAADDYVAAIAEIRSAFSHVRVVINGHDWDRGNWIGEFRRAGFEVVRGAGDSDTLERMATLFSQFEYVTTNGFGSLIAYASAFGAKASFYGPFSEVAPDSLRHIPFFMDNPELIEAEVADLKESHCRKTFPEFFCHPAEAEERTAWGRDEIGRPCKVSPDELRTLFGWSPASRAKWMARDLVGRARAAVPQPVKVQLRERATAEGRSRRRERTRLESMGAGVPGTTTLFGARFAFTDAADHLRAYDECFAAHVYRFGARSERPFIVDGDAGCGLAVLYFKCLYPQSRVVALEPDETAFSLLQRNCHTYGLHDVDLVHGTLSTQERLLPTDSPTVSGPPGGPIEMLKLGVRASLAHELGCLARLISGADHVALDYRGLVGELQEIAPVFDILSDAGLRVAVQSPDADLPRPLVELPSSRARVLRLRILGFRV